MRTAIASKKIRDWLDEVTAWYWPDHSSSAGFEMPPAKRRKVSEPETPSHDRKGKLTESDSSPDTNHFGSLSTADVERYEMRVGQIQQDLDGLDLEEIKSQVLHNHILPLSRPGTPFSDAGCSTTSASMFSRMEDLTAVVTAITVQALPNLSKLSRLLHTWSVRLLVLKKVPSLLTMITDAEVALRSGWRAIDADRPNPFEPKKLANKSCNLSRKDFEVMKQVIQQKVAQPGRALDAMLDSLEGSVDTLPDEWLDRMEEIERDYAAWEANAERKVRPGERTGLLEASARRASSVQPETPRPKIQIQGPSPSKDLPESSNIDQFASPPVPTNDSPDFHPARGPAITRPELLKKALSTPSPRAPVQVFPNEPRARPKPTSQVSNPITHTQRLRQMGSRSSLKDLSFNYDGSYDKRPSTAAGKAVGFRPESPHLRLPKKSRSQPYLGTMNKRAAEAGRTNAVLHEVNQNVIRKTPQEPKKPNTIRRDSVIDDDEDDEFSVLEPSALESVDEEGDGLDLPPARFVQHRGSRESIASTVIHGSPGDFLDNSDNAPFRDGSMEPDLPRLPDPDEPFSSDALSPPSSPPLRYKTRSTSVTFKDAPEINMLPEAGSTPPRSPIESSALFDDDTYEYESQLGSPGRMSTASNLSEDEHLQQQISELLESIPARIRLKRTPGINLNPPDFQLPTRGKAKPSDTTRRSQSSLSSRGGTPSFSRSGTPSFMLAPARDPRSKSKGSAGIRVYNLTRSTGEAPLRLLVRCVGEQGERVMVRIGGGWADLGEYLREYASHHSSRSKGEGKVDIKDLPTSALPNLGSAPSSRPSSALEAPVSPLTVRKTRRSQGEEGATRFPPRTPFSNARPESDTPSPEAPGRSRASSRLDWDEEDSSLGLAGPKGKKVDMSDESRAWVESVKEKVRIASGDRPAPPEQRLDTKFGEMGRVGGTKRLFRKN